MKHKNLHPADLLLSVLILLAAFGISLLLQHIHPSESLVSLVFVLAVFLISLLTRTYLWGMIASLGSVLIDNFIFTFPYFAFDFISPDIAGGCLWYHQQQSRRFSAGFFLRFLSDGAILSAKR